MIFLEINQVVHNVLVSCALASVTVLSIIASVFLIKWAMPAKHVEEIAQNLAQPRDIGENSDQGPADIVGTMRDLRIAAENLRNITDQLAQHRGPDDPNPENIAPIVRIVNNADRVVDHLQRDRGPDETEGDPIPVVNIVNGANRIVDHLQRDRDPDNPNDELIPVVNTVNNIQDITQAVAHPIFGTGSGLSGGVRWVGRGIGKGAKCVGRGIGGIWNYFFGGNSDEYDKTVDKDEEEDILILEPDPDWNGEEEDLED